MWQLCPVAAHQILVEAYGDHCPSYPNIWYWFQRFKTGDFDLADKERPGQPKQFEDEQLETLLNVDSA